MNQPTTKTMKNNNRNNGNTTNKNFDTTKDEGPATCALVWPFDKNYPGTDQGRLGLRVLNPNDTDDPHDNSIRGLLVVNSASEHYSVREIVLVPPVTRNGHVISGPKIVLAPSIRFSCQSCGDRVIDSRTFVKENTVRVKGEKRYEVVAADDHRTPIKGVWDLREHAVRCPVCHKQLQGFPKSVFWHINDREVVRTQDWENAIKAAMSRPGGDFDSYIPEVVEVSRTQRGPFTIKRHLDLLSNILSQQDVAINDWQSTVEGGNIGKLLFVTPEISVFNLDNAQELQNLTFGNRENRLGYSGNIGFKPRDIRIEHDDRPMVSVAEKISLTIDGITL